MTIFKSHLYAIGAYSPPLEGRNPSEHLLLDFNERTLPIGDAVKQALVDYIASGRMQMYPAYGDIVDRLAAYAGVAADQLMITNGSDQGIELVFRAACSPGDEVIIPSPSFAMYHQCAKIENARIIEPHYTREGGFPLAQTLAAITDKTRVICIANPNNPSGVETSAEDILAVAKAAPDAVVLVDECYFEYAKATIVDCLIEYPNLVVARTFSKTWGMPSLRFGYLMAAKESIAVLLGVRGPYDINQLAVVAAKAALDHPEYTNDYVDEVMSKSKPLLESFCDARGLLFWPSNANFLWVFPAAPEEVEAHLVSAGILVRPKVDQDGNVGLRVTIGSLSQTERLIAELEKVVA